MDPIQDSCECECDKEENGDSSYGYYGVVDIDVTNAGGETVRAYAIMDDEGYMTVYSPDGLTQYHRKGTSIGLTDNVKTIGLVNRTIVTWYGIRNIIAGNSTFGLAFSRDGAFWSVRLNKIILSLRKNAKIEELFGTKKEQNVAGGIRYYGSVDINVTNQAGETVRAVASMSENGYLYVYSIDGSNVYHTPKTRLAFYDFVQTYGNNNKVVIWNGIVAMLSDVRTYGIAANLYDLDESWSLTLNSIIYRAPFPNQPQGIMLEDVTSTAITIPKSIFSKSIPKAMNNTQFYYGTIDINVTNLAGESVRAHATLNSKGELTVRSPDGSITYHRKKNKMGFYDFVQTYGSGNKVLLWYGVRAMISSVPTFGSVTNMNDSEERWTFTLNRIIDRNPFP